MIIRDDEYLDFTSVPESRGVPSFLYRVLAVGLVLIFAMGAAVCLMSSYGHEWPSNHTLRSPLGQRTE